MPSLTPYFIKPMFICMFLFDEFFYPFFIVTQTYTGEALQYIKCTINTRYTLHKMTTQVICLVYTVYLIVCYLLSLPVPVMYKLLWMYINRS